MVDRIEVCPDLLDELAGELRRVVMSVEDTSPHLALAAASGACCGGRLDDAASTRSRQWWSSRALVLTTLDELARALSAAADDYRSVESAVAASVSGGTA